MEARGNRDLVNPMTPEQAHDNLNKIIAELLLSQQPIARQLYGQVLAESLKVLDPSNAPRPVTDERERERER